ncbi:TFIIH complex subunit [Starmerella bacillaris]|uniref:General transcription and DNA repair factor IIH subunit TFB5 n=1 Tax=Starmerella bacillaris TaxID=1247836 RepID=A0AAV5RDB2_STABA|nr:TFIIH complex subunit [Starmerella bacillaris]
MPSAIRGTLIECDPAIRTLILMMDVGSNDLILEELDETHLLVDSNKVNYIRNELNSRLSKNLFNPDEEEQ